MPISGLTNTQVSNDFLDNYMRILSPSATKMFIAIARKTAGLHKQNDGVSDDQIMEIIGKELNQKKSISPAINELIKHKLIVIKMTDDGAPAYHIVQSML